MKIFTGQWRTLKVFFLSKIASSKVQDRVNTVNGFLELVIKRIVFKVNLTKLPIGDTPLHLAARRKDAALCKVTNSSFFHSLLFENFSANAV
jgi:hypothetical protein